MSARAIQLGDDVRDGFADPGNLGEAVFLDQHVERDDERGKIIGGAGISLRTIGVASTQRSSLRVFPQEFSHLWGVSDRHSPHSRPSIN